MDDLTIVIISYNTKELTIECLRSIFSKKWQAKFSVFVVDNASTDGSPQAVKKAFPKVRLVRLERNLGFARGNNLALRKAKSAYYLLLNSDTEVTIGSIDNLLQFARNSDFAIASCKLLNKDGTFQPNGGQLPNFWPMFLWLSGLDDMVNKFKTVDSYQAGNEKYYRSGREVGWVSGSVMLIRGDVFKKVGYLDDKIFMYGEDVEFCWRAKRSGFDVGWTDQATVFHLGGASSTQPKLKQWAGEFRGLLYIYRKYYGRVAALLLRFLIYIFVVARMLGFALKRRFSYSRTYGKVLVNI